MVLPNLQPFLEDELPAIICLHGAGTSGEIFRLQARTILQQLKGYFRFIFVDAPFQGLPGPGVLPTYAGMKPYRWWHCDESSASKFNISIEEIRQRRQQVRRLLAKHLQDPSVVGIMAFSQGARLATGLCLDTKLGRRIKFVILIAATYPALTLEETQYGVDNHELSHSDVVPDQDEAQAKDAPLSIPSIHIQGRSDPWAVEGKRLRTTYYKEDLTTVISFAGGHSVPVTKTDAQRVMLAVMAAWDDIKVFKGDLELSYT